MKRRDFIRTNLAALGGALLAGGLPASTQAAEPAASRRVRGKPEIKLGMRVSPGLSAQHLEFMRQLGLHWCRLDVYAKDFGYEALARTRDDYEKHGLRIFSVINYARLTPALLLGGPDRETQLQAFAQGIGGDHISHRTSGMRIRKKNGFIRADNRGGFGHKINSAKHNYFGRRARGNARKL